MPPGTGSRIQVAALVALLAAMLAGLALRGAMLRDDLVLGVRTWRRNHPPPPAPTVFRDPLAGVTAELPDGVTPALFGGGLLLKLDEDGTKGALVSPLIGDRSVPATEVLTAVHRSWQAGLREAGDALRMSPMKDEGARVSAHIETGRGGDSISGEVALVRAPPGYRFEAIWSTEEDFNKDRAQLLELTRAVALAPGQAVRMEFASHHGIAVPPGFAATAIDGGIELVARADPRVKLVFLAGAGHGGAEKPEALIARYVERSLPGTEATTAVVTSYPLLKRSEQAWDVAARELDLGEGRAVVTAGLTAGRDGDAFVLVLRQAPHETWTDHHFALALAEASALWLPKGPGGLTFSLPVTHVDRTWELVYAWEIGRALRTGPQPFREALLPLALRGSPSTRSLWALPLWLAQPDGTFTNPENPLEVLVR